MGKLTELLRDRAETIRSERARRRQAIQEWTGLLDGLFVQIDAWLKASDPDGLMNVSTDSVRINDPTIGEYEVPARSIEVGDQVLEIVPKTRRVAATLRLPEVAKPVRAQGLVEIRELGWVRANLFQLPGGNWYIQSNTAPREEPDIAVEALDAERFEATLASILR